MNIFEICYCIFGYYITLYHTSIDKNIAEKLGLQYVEYINILKRFNAFYNEKRGEYFFKNQSDVTKFVLYLEEKYCVMLKLVGE